MKSLLNNFYSLFFKVKVYWSRGSVPQPITFKFATVKIHILRVRTIFTEPDPQILMSRIRIYINNIHGSFSHHHKTFKETYNLLKT